MRRFRLAAWSGGLAMVLVLAGCGTLITPEPEADANFATTIGGFQAEMRVDTTPASAPVSINGRMIGLATTTARVEVNRDGDLVDDITVTAEFPGGEIGSQTFSRGSKPPSVVTIRSGGDNSYRGR